MVITVVAADIILFIIEQGEFDFPLVKKLYTHIVSFLLYAKELGIWFVSVFITLISNRTYLHTAHYKISSNFM